MLRRSEPDVLLNIIRTPEREQVFLFTPPYLRILPAILSHKDQQYGNLEQLAGKTIAIPNGFSIRRLSSMTSTRLPRMSGLFDYGYQRARTGYSWRKAPRSLIQPSRRNAETGMSWELQR